MLQGGKTAGRPGGEGNEGLPPGFPGSGKPGNPARAATGSLSANMTMHRIWMLARSEESRLASRVARPRHGFMARKAFPCGWCNLYRQASCQLSRPQIITRPICCLHNSCTVSWSGSRKSAGAIHCAARAGSETVSLLSCLPDLAGRSLRAGRSVRPCPPAACRGTGARRGSRRVRVELVCPARKTDRLPKEMLVPHSVLDHHFVQGWFHWPALSKTIVNDCL